jgi:nucleoside-diphosphate-sugar epimerase
MSKCFSFSLRSLFAEGFELTEKSDPKPSIVAVTGASGFLGQAIVKRLMGSGMTVIAVGRGGAEESDCPGISSKKVDYEDGESIALAIRGATAIVHCAGIAHVHMVDRSGDLYARVNRDYTLRLWRAATLQGCESFVFVSSVKAYGEDMGEVSVNEDSACRPQTAYGISKLEAEKGLRDACVVDTPRLSILRLPPMYGPGMKGAIRHLFWAARWHLPLPIWGIRAQRSVLSVENAARLVEFILRSGGGVTGNAMLYAPHEPEVLTPGELYNRIYRAIHGRDIPRWLRWPTPRWLEVLLVRSQKLQALTQSLKIQSKYSETYKSAGFSPIDECLKAVVELREPPDVHQ